MKKILLFCSLFLVSFFSVNASESYVGLPHVEVDELPTATEDLIGYIYDVDDKYYVVDMVLGSFRNVEVGDNLYGKTLYFTFPDDHYLNLPNISGTQKIFYGSSSSIQYTLYETSSFINLYGSNTIYQLKNDVLTNLESIEFIYKENFCQSSTRCEITYVNKDSPSYEYIFISSDTSYEWKEISYYDWYEYEAENTDFYLLYNFSDISSFDIFSSYDFSTFSDFEKLVIVLLVNILFLAFIGLCIYILIKGLNKMVSWLF